MEDVCNQFLSHKEGRLLSGEIAQGTYNEYLSTGNRLAKVFGKKTPVGAVAVDDFRRLRASIAKVSGPVRLGNEIQRVRSILRVAFEDDLIDSPPRYGADFKKPSAKVLRKSPRGPGAPQVLAGGVTGRTGSGDREREGNDFIGHRWRHG